MVIQFATDIPFLESKLLALKQRIIGGSINLEQLTKKNRWLIVKSRFRTYERIPITEPFLKNITPRLTPDQTISNMISFV